MRVSVVGAGAWGTSLARLLSRNGHSIRLWGHNPSVLLTLAQSRRNERLLPGIDLPDNIVFEPSLSAAVQDAEAVVIAVPSQAFRSVVTQIHEYNRLVISVVKGIEHGSGLTMSGVLAETCPLASAAVLSGPSFAIEVAKDIPTAVVAASDDPVVAEAVQRLFLSPAFRVYTSTDMLGVELGGALKNVIAIAAGLSDGLGFGDNTKAALVTRAIVEIKRLALACGAREETFNGLSGIGDLVVTCFSRLSRNRGFGERMGRGESPREIAASMAAVAEGFPTARSAYELGCRKAVSTPIIDEVFAMLYEAKDVASAVRDLMMRDPKPEL